MPFREAHHIAGRAVALAESQGKALDELGLDELRTIDPRLDERVLPRLSVESSVAARRSAGGTASGYQRQSPRPGPIARSGGCMKRVTTIVCLGLAACGQVARSSRRRARRRCGR